MREIYLSQEVRLGEGVLQGKGLLTVCCSRLQNLSVAPWHSAQADAAGSTELALLNVLLLGTALNHS